MNLPADVERCGGVVNLPGWLRVGATFRQKDALAKPCENCARRLSPTNRPWQPWMAPPASVRAGGECEFRIENVEVTK